MLTDVYFPRVNGVSTSIATVRATLHSLGHQTTLVAPAYPGYEETDRDICRVEARRVPFDPEDFLITKAGWRQTLDALDVSGFDIIHVHTPFMAHRIGVGLSRKMALPLVETYHTHFEEYIYHYIPMMPKTIGRTMARMVARYIAGGVDRLVMPSRAIADTLRNYGVETPMNIVPTGLDLGEFVPGDGQAFRAQYGIDSERPVLVYVGRVAFEKNIGLLLDVVDQVGAVVPDVLLVIAGEGPARDTLQQQCANRNLEKKVQFVGYMDRGKVLWDCFCAGDVFVFPSRTETQGLVLLEAMALGVPVVGYAALGAAEVLAEGAGALVVEGDADAFSSAVLDLLSNPDLRASLGSKGRHYAAEWSTQVMTQRLVNCYEQCLQEQSQAMAGQMHSD